MEAMYNDGFVGAVFVGILALLLPALWVGWWMLADMGNTVSGRPRTHSATHNSRVRPAA